MNIKEIYIKYFIEYIDLIKSEEEAVEEILSYNKSYDFVIELNKKQDDIIDEVKSWKKFYLNSIRKNNKDYMKFRLDTRVFEPVLTLGEIQDFIDSKMTFFSTRTGEFVGFERLTEEILHNQIQKIKTTTNKIEAFENLVDLYRQLKAFSTPSVYEPELEEFKKFILDGDVSLLEENIKEIAQSLTPDEILKKMNKDEASKFIDFVFDSITDYNLEEYPNQSELRKRLEHRFKELFKTNILSIINRGIPKEDKVTDLKDIRASNIFDVVIRVMKNVKKDFITSKKIFNFNFTSALVRAINKELSPFDFNRHVRAMLRNYGRQAFQSGILSLGLEPTDFKPIENFLIRKMNSYVNYYLTNLTTKVSLGVIDVAKARVTGDSWSNRILSRFFEYGRIAADRNGVYEWVYGDTKHCRSCAYANGQRHRMRHWVEAGILPQSNGHKHLLCGGFHCKCKLVKVTGGSRGRLDRIPLASKKVSKK